VSSLNRNPPLLLLTTQANVLNRLSSHAASITNEEIKSALAPKSLSQMSTSNILANQEFAAVITDPREYQIELFERAKAENTIAVLDTGMILATP
jgi:endoribonuclease Dicer